MRICQSRTFAKKIKKFTKSQKLILDEEIKEIIKNPILGTEKKGDLRGVFVHKFKIKTSQYLPRQISVSARQQANISRKLPQP